MRDAAVDAAELVSGAAETAATLRAGGLKIASSTGYTREMMAPVLVRAAEQGYAPDHLVCSGETSGGRPSPLMVYKACVDLGVWPTSRVIKVDDAEAGVAEGRAAGCFTVGVVASGNLVGLPRKAFAALSPADRAERLTAAGRRLRVAGADMLIETIADLVPSLQQHLDPTVCPSANRFIAPFASHGLRRRRTKGPCGGSHSRVTDSGHQLPVRTAWGLGARSLQRFAVATAACSSRTFIWGRGLAVQKPCWPSSTPPNASGSICLVTSSMAGGFKGVGSGQRLTRPWSTGSSPWRKRAWR